MHPMVSIGWVSIKLDMVSNHEGIIEQKELHLGLQKGIRFSDYPEITTRKKPDL